MTVIRVVRKLLTPDELSSPNLRYDSDCDCIQSTPDGGVTWNEQPGLDPRHSLQLQLPPLTTSDPRCDAAANMTAYLHSFIDEVISAASLGSGATSILGILTIFMPEVALLVSIILEVVGGLLTIGQSALNTAFTSGVYDQLTCIFYCNIASDGTCNPDQLNSIGLDIADQIGGTVQAAMALILPLLGEVGLTNAGASGSATGDCSGCACTWCYEFNYLTGLPDWTPASGLGGSYNAGNHRWEGTSIGSGSYGTIYGVGIQQDFTATPVTQVTVRFGTSYNDGGRPTVILYLSGTQVGRVDSSEAAGSIATNVTDVYDFADINCDRVLVFMAGGVTPVTVDQIVIRGDGDNPFGINNC